MRKLKLTKLVMTLLIGSVIISGCASNKMLKPVKPTLTTVTEVDGKMCMSLQDASALGIYIIELERGYQ